MHKWHQGTSWRSFPWGFHTGNNLNGAPDGAKHVLQTSFAVCGQEQGDTLQRPCNGTQQQCSTQHSICTNTAPNSGRVKWAQQHVTQQKRPALLKSVLQLWLCSTPCKGCGCLHSLVFHWRQRRSVSYLLYEAVSLTASVLTATWRS